MARLLVPVVLQALACAGAAPEPAPRAASSRDHGYALLYALMGQQKHVSKLLIVKGERDDLDDLIQQIAETSEAAHEALEELAEDDPSFDLDDTGLPAAEVETREAIADTRTAQLLESSGGEFELQLLLAQNEALVYATHLCEVLARAEPDRARLALVRGLWTDLHRLHDGVLALLRDRRQPRS
jgi:hypothetical protein